MARNVQWRRTINDKASWKQDQGLAATIYLVREVGPTGFLLKDDGESKPVKVLLGDPHQCTCSEFRKDQELCKHLCWLLLKKFKISREDPISWQLGLVEREINSILHTEENRRANRQHPITVPKTSNLAPTHEGRPALEQRKISKEDTCPICMEELLLKHEPVTYCKYSCANSIHIKCMKIWAEHQSSSGETMIKCPYCREDFGPYEYLKEEYKNAIVPTYQQKRVIEHPNTLCRKCSQSPIQGKCYRCTSCSEFHLCQKCFNSPFHTDHSFEYRSKPAQRWRSVQRINAGDMPLPSALVNDIMNRDILDQDYDLLLQLDNSGELSQIPESVIQKFPLEKVKLGSRYLAPGEQCCVCLRGYESGDSLRRLPCRHKFHKDCIDNWLLHQRPTCPVDGQVVWSPHVDKDSSKRLRRNKLEKSKENSCNREEQPTEPPLEIPGIGIALLNSNTHLHRSGGTRVIADRISNRDNVFDGNSLNLHSISHNHIHATSFETTTDVEVGAPSNSPLIIEELLQYIHPPQDNNHVPHLLSHNQKPLNTNKEHHPSSTNPVNTYKPSLSGGRTVLSESESENNSRRLRNLSLAAKFRVKSSNGNGSASSTVSRQPSDVESLYIGNPDASLLPVEVIPSLRKERHDVMKRDNVPKNISLEGLHVGKMEGFCRKKLSRKIVKGQVSIHQSENSAHGNTQTLELNGTKL